MLGLLIVVALTSWKCSGKRRATCGYTELIEGKVGAPTIKTAPGCHNPRAEWYHEPCAGFLPALAPFCSCPIAVH